MADLLTGLARYTHIVTAVMWVGGLFLWSMLIAPSVAKRVAAPARAPFMSTVVPRMSRYMTIAGVLTLLSGVWLMGMIWEGDYRAGFEYPEGGYGIAMTLGLVSSLVMIGIGVGVLQPTGTKLLDVMAKAPPGPPSGEALGLQKRLMMGSMANMLLGFVALGVMAWAVNVFR